MNFKPYSVHSPAFNHLVTQARSWGFICQEIFPGKWQIVAQNDREDWQLQAFGERWLFSIDEIPQMIFSIGETERFLERYYYKYQSEFGEAIARHAA